MGILLGLSSGFFHALMSLASKKTLKDADEYTLAFSYAFFSLPFLFVALMWLDVTSMNFPFWYATVASAVLSCIATLLLMYALRVGDLSYSVPLLSFTPVFLILTSAIMIGEMPTYLGVLGIVIIAIGVYVMSIDPKLPLRDLSVPVRSLLANKGARAILAVALIHAISSNFNKIAVENSTPLTYLIFVQLLSAFILLPFLALVPKSRARLESIKKNSRPLLIVGFLVAASLLAQMTALTVTLVSYVIALKRTSALFSVLLGFIVLKEKNIPIKFAGAFLMMVGVTLIVIA